MKKVFTLMLGLVAGSTSFAQSTGVQQPTGVTLKVSQQAVQLYIQPKSTTATVALLDAEGHILYSTKTNLASGFRQQFNVSALEAGAYQLSIQTAQQTIVKPFRVEDQSIQRHVTLQV